MPASRMREKRMVECKIADENGRYSAISPTEKKVLTALEAIKMWCKESQLHCAYPRSMRIEDLLEKIQENFKVTREPAYRRVQKAIHEYECLTADVREKRRGVYIIYDRAKDSKPTVKTTIFYKEPEETPKKKSLYDEIMEKAERKKEQEEPIDIYKLLEEAERKHKERQLAKST